MIVDANADVDSRGMPAVNFRFDRDGARLFSSYTADNIGKPFAIVLNGDVMSAPTVRDQISGGTGVLTGTFTVDQAENLALMMRSGALPSGLVVVSQASVDGSDPSADFCP
jgi:preprotein translocase subunit SecD